MFEVIDILGRIYTAYGTFIDEDGDVQFIFCRHDGTFYKTSKVEGFYRLYKGEE